MLTATNQPSCGDLRITKQFPSAQATSAAEGHPNITHLELINCLNENTLSKEVHRDIQLQTMISSMMTDLLSQDR